MDCILTAGGIPDLKDPLYTQAGGRPKSLIALAGKPMVQWVLAALDAAPTIESIVIVGLPASVGLVSSKIIAYLPDQGDLLTNALAGVEQLLKRTPDMQQLLACSGDVPLLTAEKVEWLIAQSSDPAVDMYYSCVSRSVMERRFPDSARSYIHFKDGEFAGGDLHVASPYLLTRNQDVWEDVVRNRKSMLKQALRLGPKFFIKFILRQLTLSEASDIVFARFGLRVEPIVSPYAELAMDVDKPHQLELCRRELVAHQP